MNTKTVDLEPKDLTDFQIQISVEPDLEIVINTADPMQLLNVTTRIFTILKDGLDLKPKVKVLP